MPAIDNRDIEQNAQQQRQAKLIEIRSPVIGFIEAEL